MKFREDIEGLRGVAILLVVFSHAGVPGLSAGYIGVDVFFVISGYLITGLLAEELREKGKINYWAFYARRAKRLAPALVSMVVLVTMASLFWLRPEEVLSHLTAAIWALLWSANLHFAFAGIQYFGDSSSLNLFLHCWSLGVEEQFYLLWPIVLALAWRPGGKGLLLFGLVSAVGFAVCLWMLLWDAKAAFYLMPTRLWQLALGGFAHQLVSMVSAHSASWPRAALGVVGLLGIAGGLIVLRDGDSHPGWPSLFPTLGAAAVLFAGGHSGALANLLLRLPPIRFAGRISYSWYLWHWPFLVWPMVVGLPLRPSLLSPLLIFASFLVACASFALIEQPVRRVNRWSGRRTVLFTLSATALLVLLLKLLWFWKEDEASQDAALLERTVYQQLILPEIYQRDCDDWFHSSRLMPCEVGERKAESGSVVLIADSVGAQWVPALEHAANLQQRPLIVLTKSSCPIVDLPVFYPRINRRFTECEDWRVKAIDFVAKTNPAVVVIGSTQNDFDREDLVAGTERLLRALAGPDRALVVLAPTPILPFDAPRCVASTGWLGEEGLEAPECAADLPTIDPVDVADALSEAAERVEGASVLRLNDLVCPDGVCRAVAGGAMVFRDSLHLNAPFAAGLAVQFEERLRRASGVTLSERAAQSR